MKIHKLYIALGLMIAFVLFFEFAAHADEANEQTKITFSTPIQIPGQVLPAGTYIFQQADSNDLNLIQIFTADRGALVATFQTASAERREPAGDTVITLAEPETGDPVLVKWFYPGRTIGHEFIYSKQQERELSTAKQQTVVGNESLSSGEAVGE
jgi:Protein of unknown function (DUF2911)